MPINQKRLLIIIGLFVLLLVLLTGFLAVTSIRRILILLAGLL